MNIITKTLNRKKHENLDKDESINVRMGVPS